MWLNHTFHQSNTETSIREKRGWKNCMESKEFRVNLDETKVMICDVNQGPMFTSGKHPSEVCCTGVGLTSSFAVIVLTGFISDRKD